MMHLTKRRNGALSNKIAIAIFSFVFGCILSTMVVLNYVAISNSPPSSDNNAPRKRRVVEVGHELVSPAGRIGKEQPLVVADPKGSISGTATSMTSILAGKRILIAIAAFDFNQIPHLGEVLDAYQDLCVTGASKVDVIVHATVAYPVTLIDLMNSRLLPGCRDIFSITIVLKPQSIRLHLVDYHRELFYRKIDDYDLFIYTEDDIRVPPRVAGAYLSETEKVERLVGLNRSQDFNVGIVRYEYDFPSNVIMDDKTRQATQNVTRVYWEHGFDTVIGDDGAVRFVDAPELKDSYISMRNDHQGMFLATSYLLKAWKVRCKFDVASNRPARKNDPNQPAEGTQRVWMSSRMLHGSKYCNVKQVLPIDSFGTLTVLHLPNKNYRRVGRYRNRTFSDGTETFAVSKKLLSETKLHVQLRNATKQKSTIPYNGIKMVDEVGDKKSQRRGSLERRLREYQSYVDRGGILSTADMGKTLLVENS